MNSETGKNVIYYNIMIILHAYNVFYQSQSQTIIKIVDFK